ncbi:hypothetical protein BH10PSE13_BH10PSE13_17860 [soil metagenome]
MTPPPQIPRRGPFPGFAQLRSGCWGGRATFLASVAFSLSLSIGYARSSVPETAAVTASPFSYADVADLASHAEIVAVARPRSLARVDPKIMPSPLGMQRFYVDTQVDSLIRGEAGLPSRVAFLLDLPEGTKPSVMKGKSLILFGRPGTRPGEIQLLSSTAVLPWSQGTEARARSITAELLAQDAPPEITRVVEAFHVEGTVAGESETQIFLATRGGQPVSLSVVRRPDMEPRFGAALGEIVDEAANLPAPDTLLWYRLACGRPPALPMSAAMKLDGSGAQAAAADYRSFMERLAPCARTRVPAPGPKLGNGGTGG